MRGLCISFTSSCFLFPIGGGAEKVLEMGVGGVKILGLGEITDFRFGGGELLLLWGSVPHYMSWYRLRPVAWNGLRKKLHNTEKFFLKKRSIGTKWIKVKK